MSEPSQCMYGQQGIRCFCVICSRYRYLNNTHTFTQQGYAQTNVSASNEPYGYAGNSYLNNTDTFTQQGYVQTNASASNGPYGYAGNGFLDNTDTFTQQGYAQTNASASNEPYGYAGNSFLDNTDTFVGQGYAQTNASTSNELYGYDGISLSLLNTPAFPEQGHAQTNVSASNGPYGYAGNSSPYPLGHDEGGLSVPQAPVAPMGGGLVYDTGSQQLLDYNNSFVNNSGHQAFGQEFIQGPSTNVLGQSPATALQPQDIPGPPYDKKEIEAGMSRNEVLAVERHNERVEELIKQRIIEKRARNTKASKKSRDAKKARLEDLAQENQRLVERLRNMEQENPGLSVVLTRLHLSQTNNDNLEDENNYLRSRIQELARHIARLSASAAEQGNAGGLSVVPSLALSQQQQPQTQSPAFQAPQTLPEQQQLGQTSASGASDETGMEAEQAFYGMDSGDAGSFGWGGASFA
ncbi:hypothetical protein F5X97DRAFT_340371 [Nemania serpens]|nr:hypothetical protein F5X97DRAFT_340371 [Nemania serpens]